MHSLSTTYIKYNKHITSKVRESLELSLDKPPSTSAVEVCAKGELEPEAFFPFFFFLFFLGV
jgi:hypothetical protein